MRIRERDLGFWIGIPMLSACAVGLLLAPPDWRRGLLAGASVFALWPHVLDALVQPRFRRGLNGVPSLEVPGFGFVIAGLLTCVCVFGLTFGDPDPTKLRDIKIGALVLPSIATFFAGWCVKSTWADRRRLARLSRANDALEGSLSVADAPGPQLSNNLVLAMYGKTVSATHSTVSESTVRETELAKVTERVDLHVHGGRWKMVLLETEWLSLERRDEDLPSNSLGDHANRYDALTTSQQVLVVGAQRDGAIDRPVLFAAKVGKEARPSLRRMVRRQRLTLGLAVLGVIALAVAPAF